MQASKHSVVRGAHLSSRTTISTAFRSRCAPRRPSIAQGRRVVSTHAMFGLKKSSLAFLTVAKNTPHPEKVAKGGEDAWFIRVDAKGGGAFGVADGVGGYDEFGVDSGLFSKRLMQLAAEKEQTQSSSPDPKGIMEYAHRQTILPGACTACIVQLQGSKMYAANLGDSGFIVIRNGDKALATEPLQHFFDCPYQLNNSDTAPTDNAEDATMIEMELQEGDIIVAGSDGLFDNVFQDDIISIATSTIADSLKAGKSPLEANEAVAEELAALAYQHSQDLKYPSPYAIECNKDEAAMKQAQTEKLKQGGIFGKALGGVMNAVQTPTVVGGKLDDITVLVSTVVAPGSNKAALEGAAAAAAAGLEPVMAQLASGMRILQEKETKSATPIITRKKLVRSGQAKIEGAGITVADIENMDKATIQKMLMKYDLPTSGSMQKLKDRLAKAIS
uniref:Protein phosphatase n=1 Tax=Pyramimonas obovata TaxID=1411642 RepID=A0A6T7VR05_9CHLO|eukprot:CAMPEP_0118934244 /NCGR_PEP_ID=MMETSP1169-20130426/13717_1 /TAXON_ID=36882 /ORGANISM="Pyramimonas obovata, Strain CCMP722" /LENGTH=444 /DNA_ID=CAMNT_0006877125 /DNA_START=32 /DNA_END=1366 /DNA_ORIENTATION=-